MFAYICVSGSLEDRVVEYVDHLHEHFVDPVVIRAGRYMPPTAPGYSITMRPESLARYAYPHGSAWSSPSDPLSGGSSPPVPLSVPERGNEEPRVVPLLPKGKGDRG